MLHLARLTPSGEQVHRILSLWTGMRKDYSTPLTRATYSALILTSCVLGCEAVVETKSISGGVPDMGGGQGMVQVPDSTGSPRHIPHSMPVSLYRFIRGRRTGQAKKEQIPYHAFGIQPLQWWQNRAKRTACNCATASKPGSYSR